MRKRLFGMTILFSLLIITITFGFYFSQNQMKIQDLKQENIVAINEIEQLAKLDDYEQMHEKADDLQKKISSIKTTATGNNRLFAMCGLCITFVVIVFLYVYFAILRPFDKMKGFAQKISQGDFDVALDYERSNYFGEFTWAFDSMRREVTKARSCEREAIENNKTIIATLSHDIKTPISSIRAYAEGLEANLDATPDKRAKYLAVIMKKCDEVSKLTNDLFLHSISDLDKLKISAEEVEVCGFLEKVISEIGAEQNDINFVKQTFTANVFLDVNRFIQICENIINNARKYAKSKIDISLSLYDDTLQIHFRDYGNGIPDEDMPFIYDKFYRGKNCGDEQGSGLGLYIVKYIVEKIHGDILLHNHNDGLEVIIKLPIISHSS